MNSMTRLEHATATCYRKRIPGWLGLFLLRNRVPHEGVLFLDQLLDQVESATIKTYFGGKHMKSLLSTILLNALLLAASAADIPKGTHVLLRMVNSVTTKTAQVGDQVYLQTASPISVDGQIVVPVGAYVQGTVSQSVRSARVKGRAELALRFDQMTLPDGRVRKISPRLSSVDSGDNAQKIDDKESTVKQAGNKEKDLERAGKIAAAGAAMGGIGTQSLSGAGIGGGAGLAAGLLTALFTRGNEVELKQGTTIDVVFDRDALID